MNKHGFTLAEVLVTLGIIGVVAALTTPALIQNVGNAKIGPKLQKIKSTFETAAEMMLTEHSANSILAVTKHPIGLIDEMSKHMKVAVKSEFVTLEYKEYGNTSKTAKSIKGKLYGGTSSYIRNRLKDGTIIMIEVAGEGQYGNFAKLEVAEDYADIPNNQLIGYVYVDINGDEKPNMEGKDLFVFALYNDGTLRPYGAHDSIRSTDPSMEGLLWSEDGNCDANGVANGKTCAGSIFENDMKIIYD